MSLKDVTMPNAYGTWKVTTEGDCEGRSTRDLGVHTGFLDEIAFALAAQAYYGLRFDIVNQDKLKGAGPTGVEVQVSLGIDTGSWDLSAAERVAYFKKLLKGRPNVLVEDGQYYACVKLCSGDSPEARERARKQVLLNSARAKLTEDERKALGL
jgi:hypothetical protein